ncbi:MAG: MmgE/PrpD family protein [Alphaproteobacteria bacterium]|nr:MmgE/PrpD family protein [Alphaproteobacteria bacterium]
MAGEGAMDATADTDDRTRALAEWAAALSIGDVSQADRAQLAKLVLDHLGVCFRGAFLPWGAALQDWASVYANSGKAPVFASGLRVAPPVAGMVNASCAHGLEHDDTHDEGMSHPGAIVIAVALAVGTELGLSGRDILPAIVAGYEVMARVGMACGPDVMHRGYHPTALFGGFGATTTAGKLYGLDAGQLVEAWGLMLSMAGGSMQFSQDPHGTVVKRLHGGYGAHNGTVAAQLAKRGIAGPARAFDGLYGLCRLFSRNPDLTRLVRAKDAPYEIHRISFKPYPSCRLFHSTIDALRTVTGGFKAAKDDIAKIVVGGPKIFQHQHMMYRPTSMMAAQYSLPYVVGAALVEGPYAEHAFVESNLGNADILSFADKVSATEDANLEKAFPAHFGSWVEVTFAGGRTARAEVLDSYGTPANPMDVAALTEKFSGLVRGVARDFPVERVVAMVNDLPALARVADLAQLFAR